MSITLTGLEDRVAIVTGAARRRSLGRTIAVELAKAGCDVVITGTSRPISQFPADEQEAGWRGLDSVAEEIEAQGRRALKVVTDKLDEPTAQRLVDTTIKELGRIDILVNNAAAARGADRVPVIELDGAVWQNVLDVNLSGAFHTSKAFATALVAQGGGGSIVNISSIGGKLAGATIAAYGSSKAGLQALTTAMAQELGPQGIRVNALCPGVVRTSRLDDQSAEMWELTRQNAIPLRRFGEETDISNLLIFLCSDQGSWITGQAWNIDGGMLMIR